MEEISKEKVKNVSSVKNISINTLTIRLSGKENDKCCFDVLGNGLELCEGLTFGELIEYLVVVYRNHIFGVCYTLDYPYITINNSIKSF